MKLLAALALAAVSACTPAPKQSPNPEQPPQSPPSAPADAELGDTASADPIALRLCLDNFERLNPGLSEVQAREIFCATPDALAPWTRQALINPNAGRLDAGAH